jgi:SAM-dependent methyltransferase
MKHALLDAANRWLQNIARRLNKSNTLPDSPPSALTGLPTIQFARLAIQQLVAHEDFHTVLDVGCGAGEHAAYFLAHGKEVTAIDLGRSPDFSQRDERIHVMVGDFNQMEFRSPFDCVWASHVLEHQPNVQHFLTRIHRALREGGVLATTVPPLKHEVVGGHLSLWNAGLLLYNLVIAGFDCREARVLKYDYDISVILRKRTIQLPANLAYDAGDIRQLRDFFPASLQYRSYALDDPFDGDIQALNWYP